MSPSHLRWRLATTASCLFVAIVALLGAFDPYEQIQIVYASDTEGGGREYFYYRGQKLTSPLSEDASWRNTMHHVALQGRYFLGVLYGILSLFLVAYVIEDVVLLLTYKEKVPSVEAGTGT
jgi:hypothetical protein